jgi:hypothetical protein
MTPTKNSINDNDIFFIVMIEIATLATDSAIPALYLLYVSC